MTFDLILYALQPLASVGVLKGESHVACQFKKKAMSRVSVAYFPLCRASKLRKTISHVPFFFLTPLSHVALFEKKKKIIEKKENMSPY